MVVIMSLNHLTWRSTLKPNSCSGSHCFRFSDVSMKRNLCRNQVCLTNVWFFNFLAVFVVAVSELQRKSVAAKVCCSQLNLMFCYVSNEPAALPSPLFSSVLRVGWLASWPCHWLVIFPGQVWRVEAVIGGVAGVPFAFNKFQSCGTPMTLWLRCW